MNIRISINKIVLILLSLYFFLIPSGIAAILNNIIPISYDGRLSGGGVIILLIIVFLLMIAYRGKWRYTYLDIFIFLLIGTKIISWININSQFPSMDNDIYISQRNVLISTIITYLSYYVLIYFITFKDSILNKYLTAYSFGAITTIIGSISLVYFYGFGVGFSNLFEMKRNMVYNTTNFINRGFDLSSISLLQRWTGGIESTLTLGPFLGFLGSLFLGLSFFNKRKYFFLVLSLLAYLSSFLMISRSGILCIIFGSFTVLLCFQIVTNRSLNIFLKNIIAVSLFIFFVAFSIIYFTDYGTRFTFEKLMSQPRIYLWLNVIRLMALNPLGYGQAYILLEKGIGSEVFPAGVTFTQNHAHSAFFQSGIEMGIIGMFLVIIIILSSIFICYKNILLLRKIYLHSKPQFPSIIGSLNLGISGALIAALIGMLFESKFFISNSILTPNIILIIALCQKINKYLKITTKDMNIILKNP